ncbi:MAG: hypothetical protein H6707_03935 [Deltaproteobacteria bacterium]|nr:hypothetical protein [Deltaproteobacteria bacterium]
MTISKRSQLPARAPVKILTKALAMFLLLATWGCSRPTLEDVRTSAKANLFELLRFAGKTLDDPTNRDAVNAGLLRLEQTFIAGRSRRDIFRGEDISARIEDFIARLEPVVDDVIVEEFASDIDNGMRFDVRADRLCRIFKRENPEHCTAWGQYVWQIDATLDGDRLNLRFRIGNDSFAEISIQSGKLQLVGPVPKRLFAVGRGSTAHYAVERWFDSAVDQAEGWFREASEASATGGALPIDQSNRATLSIARHGNALRVDVTVDDLALLYDRRGTESDNGRLYAAIFDGAKLRGELGGGAAALGGSGEIQLIRHYLRNAPRPLRLEGSFKSVELRASAGGDIDGTVVVNPGKTIGVVMDIHRHVTVSHSGGEGLRGSIGRVDDFHSIVTLTQQSTAHVEYIHTRKSQQAEIDVSWDTNSKLVPFPEGRDVLLMLYEGGASFRSNSKTLSMTSRQCLHLDGEGTTVFDKLRPGSC